MISPITERDVFLRAEKPNNSDPYVIGEAVLDWLKDNIPYNRAVYRPDVALDNNGGNCVARTIGGVALLNSWDIPSAVVYDGKHAHIVASSEDKIIFIESASNAKPFIRNIASEATWLGLPGLTYAYTSKLPDALNSRKSFNIYFECDSRIQSKALETDKVRSGRHPSMRNRSHIISDPFNGVQMLTATLDLKRYLVHKPEKYAQQYEKLISFVPDFVKLPKPNEVLDKKRI